MIPDLLYNTDIINSYWNIADKQIYGKHFNHLKTLYWQDTFV